jgi:hypothetical protein
LLRDCASSEIVRLISSGGKGSSIAGIKLSRSCSTALFMIVVDKCCEAVEGLVTDVRYVRTPNECQNTCTVI